MKVTVSRSDRQGTSFAFHHREVFSDEADGEDHNLEVVIEVNDQTFRIWESGRGIFVEQSCEFIEGSRVWTIGLEYYASQIVACERKAMEAVTSSDRRAE